MKRWRRKRINLKILKPVLTKKGLKKLGGADKLKCIDIILEGIDKQL